MFKLAFALALFVYSVALFGATIHIQDLGNDFVPQAGNANGDLVGHLLSTNQAAHRKANGTIIPLGTLGGAESRATGISDDGTVIVGWAHNPSGIQNTFRYVGGTMTAPFSINTVNNRAVGLDGLGNIIVNLESGLTQRVYKWNIGDSTSTLMLNNAQADGVNLAGKVIARDIADAPIYHDGSVHTILPTNYIPSGGLSDLDLSVGSLSNLAAYYRLGDAMAQIIPNILSLGIHSEATGANDLDNIVGNTASTTFFYSLMDDTLTDLNEVDYIGASALTLDEIYGVTDSNKFFGKYTDLANQTRFFQANFAVPEPSALDMLGFGVVKVIVFGRDQDEEEDEKEE